MPMVMSADLQSIYIPERAVIFLDTSPGPQTYRLVRKRISVDTVTLKDKTGDAAQNPITVVTDDGSLIDGQATLVLDSNYSSYSFCWNGDGWSVI
jgi:hypothetical protein